MSVDQRSDRSDHPDELWGALLRAGEVAAPSEEVLARARERLRGVVDRDRTVLALRRRRRRRTMIVAAAVTALVALGAVGVEIGGRRLGPDPAAAATLERAARAALGQRDPVVGPGQYLEVIRREQEWTVEADDGGVVRGRDGRPAASEGLATSTTWIPSDVTAPWTVAYERRILRWSTSDPRYRVGGTPASVQQEPSPAAPGEAYRRESDPRWYADLPSDPDRLMRVLDRAYGAEDADIGYRFAEVYVAVLRDPLTPARVRAALFEGLAATPGMRVRGDVTVLDGRRGVAIGASDVGFALVLDRATGLLIGEVGTSDSFPDVPGLDADRTTFRAAVSVRVVDRLPDRARLGAVAGGGLGG